MDSSNGKKRIAPDPDVIGLAAASLCATITMAVGFWRGVDGFSIAIRVGLVFVVTYGATFLFVRSVVRIVVGEFVERNRRQQEEEKAQRAAASQESSSKTGREV